MKLIQWMVGDKIVKITFLETLYPDIVNGLREDMNNELENLKLQYEEQRRVEVEKIRTKYLKKK